MFPLVNMVSLQLLLLAVAALTKKKTPSSFVLSGQTAVGPIKFESTGLMRCKSRIQSDCVLKRAVVAMKPALPPAPACTCAAARVPARATEEDSQAADPLQAVVTNQSLSQLKRSRVVCTPLPFFLDM